MPEDEDDICPECGADWEAGEFCEDDCDINAAYEAEMEDEN